MAGTDMTTSSGKVRLGVIGVGHLGTLHARLAREIPDAELAGVYDAQSAQTQKIAAELSTTPAESVDDLLARVDAVTIATSTTAHFEIARQALEQGKDVLIEKPITQTVAEADALCRIATERGRIIQVGHIERFNPAILALEGYNINPLFIESHRLAQFKPRGLDVAVVLDLMIHDIDVILSFVRSPVKQIDANGVAVVSDNIDIANARLQFENGCVANVTASRISQRAMRKMRLFQPNTYISIDFSEGLAEVFRLVGEGSPGIQGAMMLGELGLGDRKRKVLYEQPEVKEVNALKYEIELFVRAVRERSRPVVSGEDGRRALDVASSIMQKISQQPMII
jgi:predicted dehydrogenase